MSLARHYGPTIPDDKINYFREQLFRELAHMFIWEGLPRTIPHDYLERSLVRHGYVLFYEDENIGLDVLQAEVTGYNRHNMPTQARTFSPTTNHEVKTQIERNIRRLSDGGNVVEDFNPKTDGVLISNMEYGQSCHEIVNHFAKRLALVQQSLDTNLIWSNIPYIFQVSSDETRLSIEKLFSEIFTGKPFTIVDKYLFQDNKDRAGVPSGIPFIAKELLDVYNEIMMKFRETVGIKTAGVDKAERVNTLEVESNDQHTKTVLQIMLEQRQIAAENINAFFKTNISVRVVGSDSGSSYYNEGVEEDGTSDSRIEESFED